MRGCASRPGVTLLRVLDQVDYPYPCCPLSPRWTTASRATASASAPPAPRRPAGGVRTDAAEGRPERPPETPAMAETSDIYLVDRGPGPDRKRTVSDS